jgi:hypothetical protein
MRRGWFLKVSNCHVVGSGEFSTPRDVGVRSIFDKLVEGLVRLVISTN